MGVRGQRAVHADRAEGGDADQPEPEPVQREDADGDREDDDADIDPGEQGRLVVGAERVDGPAPDRFRGQQDDPVADDDDRRCGRPDERRDRFADAERPTQPTARRSRPRARANATARAVPPPAACPDGPGGPGWSRPHCRRRRWESAQEIPYEPRSLSAADRRSPATRRAQAQS